MKYSEVTDQVDRIGNELHREKGVNVVRECLESSEAPSSDWAAHGNTSPVAWPNPIHPAGLMAHTTEHIARYVVLTRLAIIAVMLWTFFTDFVRPSSRQIPAGGPYELLILRKNHV